MKKNLFNFLILLLTLSSFSLCYSQNRNELHIPDSLKNKNYTQLEVLYNKNTEKAMLYANTILNKAKKEQNNTEIIKGYLLLFKTKRNSSLLPYLDSAITISKKVKSADLLSEGYMYKGNYFYHKGEYSSAITHYIEARNYANNNSYTYHIINFNIGLLKLEVKEYQEAIPLFLSYKKYIEQHGMIKKLDYMSCIYALAYTYSQMNDLVHSNHYINVGLKKNTEIKDGMSESLLLMVRGINAYKIKKYSQALADLKLAATQIEKKSYGSQNLAISEYYIGKILYDLNDKKFLNQFKKVDSIIIQSKNPTEELRHTYPILIDYYKKAKNKEMQLTYIEHLLSVDSILNNNNHFLIKEINKKYDTPILLKEREYLLDDLSSKNNILTWLVIGGVFALGLLLLVVIKNRKKIKLYQQNAQSLIHNSESSGRAVILNTPPIPSLEYNETKSRNKTVLSDDNLKKISLQLDEFERKRYFLNKKINMEKLSRDFNTNRAYLSKSINELKGQSFPQYLNELRIQYIIKELKENKNLHKLTIAAIAEEAGFNNTESFTTAFKKITGTLPSYYIKIIQEDNKR
ncbi:helix-turn-helix domain-containing protein [Elizabethkingia meningoseptica]|uniref:helix-turn-helix domain-containing protein n=1 Tax=Elizabethkingia meningoseptica TaxID=238 RepID=UPI0020133B77|nr:AraC family transcriptional regulator [Elizabethkingia meningoseptica]MCL1676813.1 AraC family transcriptional regulator [Elizabethkingia meningoseptica]MCL1686582.1 AraC family transcriptional regulator [Elizabethkingia meningoseptica]